MKVRWLGNACVEIVAEERVIIDPHPTVDLKGRADKIFITHEHDDHFDKDTFDRISKDAETYAPKHTLNKFDIQGKAVKPGDEFSDIKVLDCDCWKSKESVGFYYKGILHPGDSAEFYVDEQVLLAFSPCFESNYYDYLESVSKTEPGLVVPFHYDHIEKKDEAEGLVDLLKKEGFSCKLLSPGDELIL